MKKSIEEVKKEHEMEWIKLPGIEGVGLSKENEEDVIVVFYSDQNASKDQIPSEVEGYKVIIKNNSEFKAF